MLSQFLDFFLHIDKYIEWMFTEYQTLTYVILCLILFCETGLVFTPFLPGDSLLFAVGATVAKIGILQIEYLIPLMILAVLLGDNVNYFLGKFIGKRIVESDHPLVKKLIKPEYLERTSSFYEKYGGRTVILARFIPIIRTFAPFVAGLGAMTYPKYITFCVIGAIGWVTGMTMLGYLFGTHPFVQANFKMVLMGVILISLMPVVIQVLVAKYQDKKALNK
jgi:membrane-associated protein